MADPCVAMYLNLFAAGMWSINLFILGVPKRLTFRAYLVPLIIALHTFVAGYELCKLTN